MELFQGIGLCMSAYGLISALAGKVYAKSGMTARYVFKEDEPISFWIVCIGYLFVGMLIFFASNANAQTLS